MPPFNLELTFVSDDEAKQMASRQALLFLSLGGPTKALRYPAPSQFLFSLSALREDAFAKQPPLLNWKTRPIYDVDERLLFYDQTLPLYSNNELYVRIGASQSLGTPVWSVGAGTTINFDGLITRAVSSAKQTVALDPILVGDEPRPRIICYGYPRLGILCSSRTRPSQRFVVDLWDLSVVVPVDSLKRHVPEESPRTIWSPYDVVSAIYVAKFRSRWAHNLNFLRRLPEVPERVDDLPGAIAAAGGHIEDVLTTKPELEKEGQEQPSYCAAATAKMILKHYGIGDKSQFQIAVAMETTDDGATPDNQVDAIPDISEKKLAAVPDTDTSFEEAKREIDHNRPFKTGNGSHARACGGYLTEVGGKQWLYVYDPLPTGIGRTYYEAWDAGQHADFMYVSAKT